jgi:hypothetical protein
MKILQKEETMKTLSMILMFGIVLLVFSATVFAANYTGKFYGEVESLPDNGYAGIWIIKGTKVQVSNNTAIEEKHGKASVGAFAEVKGQQSGDIFTAYEIEIKQGKDFKKSAYPGKFYGTLESLPEKGWHGIWVINGREILITGQTRIEEEYGRIAVGALVKVEGNYSGNKFTAYEIEVKGESRYRDYDVTGQKTDKSKSRDYSPHREKVYNIKFAGPIESIPVAGYEGQWMVNGRKVEVTNKTLIDETAGKTSQGAYVEVKGIRQGETITAYEIEIKGTK